MSTPQPDIDPGDQEQRTLLAWRRIALSLMAAGALIGHLAGDPAGRVPVAAVLAGLGGVIAYAWLTPGRHVAAAGLSLVLGVLLLSALALLSLLAA